MKNSRIYLVLVSLIVLVTLLSGCTGGSLISSWAGVTVVDNTAYVAHNNHVYAIDATTGAEIDRFPLEPQNGETFYAAPVLSPDGQLIVASYKNHVYSLDPTNLSKGAVWTFPQAKDRFLASPLATEDGIYAPSTDGNLYAINPADGSLMWKFTAEHALWGTPATDGDRIYLPSMDHYMYALDPANGNVTWKTEDLGGAIVGTPVISNSVIYIGTFGNELIAIDANSGQVQKRFAAEGWVWAGPTLAGEQLYFADLKGFVYALNLSDFSQVWKVQPETAAQRAISDRPLLAGDTLYVTAESGNLFDLDPTGGNTRWAQPKTVGGKLYGAPIPAGDLLLLAPVGEDAVIVAVDRNGDQKWPFTPGKNPPGQ